MATINDSDIIDISRLCRLAFSKEPCFGKYLRCVYIGKKHRNRYEYSLKSVVKFFDLPNNIEKNQQSQPYPKISFENFDLEDLAGAGNYDYNYSRSRGLNTHRSDDSKFNSVRFLTPWKLLKDDNSLKGYFKNVCYEAKSRSSIINFVDVESFLNRLTTVTYDVCQCYFAGKNNNLIAVLSTDGTLVFRWVAIKNIIKNSGADIASKCILNTLKDFHKIEQIYENCNMEFTEDDVRQKIEELTRNELIKRQIIKMYPFDGHSLSRQEIDEQIKSAVEKVIKERIQNTVFDSLNGGYVYVSIIKKIVLAQKEKEAIVKTKSFNDGLKFGLKLEMLGWTLCEEEFASEKGIYWVKDVKMVPSTFMYHERRYEMPEVWKKIYHIDKLYLNSEGRMKATGNHPNVSGQRVCMGDLQIDMSHDDDKLRDSLSRASSLLDMINFDSSYYKPKDFESVWSNCKCLEVLNEDRETKHNQLEMASSIISLDFSSADVLDLTTPQLDVPEDNKNEVILDENGETSAIIESEDEPVMATDTNNEEITINDYVDGGLFVSTDTNTIITNTDVEINEFEPQENDITILQTPVVSNVISNSPVILSLGPNNLLR